MVLFLALLGVCQFLTPPQPNILPASCRVLDLSGADYSLWHAPVLVFGRYLPISSTEKCRLLPCSSRWPFFGIWIAPQCFLNFAPTSCWLRSEHCLRATLLLIGRRFFFVSFVWLSSFRWWKKFSWRGFPASLCYRRNISSEFPFGKFNWLSFAVVTVAFTFSHSRPRLAGRVYHGRALQHSCLSHPKFGFVRSRPHGRKPFTPWFVDNADPPMGILVGRAETLAPCVELYHDCKTQRPRRIDFPASSRFQP